MNSSQTAVLVLAVALLGVAAFLAMAETSLSRLQPYRAQALVEDKRRGAVALQQLVDPPERFAGNLNSVLLLVLATQVTAATSLAYLLLEFIDGPAFVAAVVVEIIVGYVVAEAIPKTIAVQHPERVALFTAPIIRGLTRAVPMRAITRALIGASNILVPGKGLQEGPFIYEQQILALADSAAAESAMERDERELIHSVIEFGSTIAREVMVPRTDMVTIAADGSANAAIDVALASGFSRLPVHGEETDAICGLLFTKDLLRAMRDGRHDVTIGQLMRDAKYIPETKRVAELLREMQREKVHMAIVIDEHGTVVGLVTLEDLVEEVVGDISDEYDTDDQPQIEKTGSSEWRIDARMAIDEVNDKLQLTLPHGDWDTVGGLLIDAFGRVPNRGESTVVGTNKIWVEQTSGRRIVRVRVKLEPEVVTVDDSSTSA